MSATGPSSEKSDGSLTAVDYLESQLQLEKEAREAMPYEPDTCTYPQSFRQLVFACLTCRTSNRNSPIGVCYSCSIQCHSTHELVELFSKRNFVCDCGTSRMGSGSACAIREKAHLEKAGPNSGQVPRMRTGSFSAGPDASSRALFTRSLPPATDIEGSGNSYNHNFGGRFCSCAVLYNPLQETRTMHQCYLGDVCGEDWFHQECILGYEAGTFASASAEKNASFGSAENKLDALPPPGEDAAAETIARLGGGTPPVPEDDDEPQVPFFPATSSFGEFICWQCVSKHRAAFDAFRAYSELVAATRPHFEGVKSADAWGALKDRLEGSEEVEQASKRLKTEGGKVGGGTFQPYSVFLQEDFHVKLPSVLAAVAADSPLRKLLASFEFLLKEDPIYQPEEEDVMSTQASEGSLYDLGSSALSALPVPQAMEGLQAYDAMKQKLRGFFKDFVDQKKVVTEEEVRDFFGKMKKE